MLTHDNLVSSLSLKFLTILEPKSAANADEIWN